MECLRNNFTEGVVLGGRYQTISPLNHGSFGMVFLARDMRSDETVAIKCLTKKEAATDAGFDYAIDDKSEELSLHRRLGSHRNIVSLIDSFETDAHMYLVLEFCSRGDLYEAIRIGHGPLETGHVRRFMLELVDAVTYMHSKGVYHRDIKPENIFLTQSGAMKLGDFGLATTERWTYETTVGSDRYMSPEQYDAAGAGYSPGQADIWAIGICLLNILFSRNPFTKPTESDPLFLDFSRDKQSLFDVFPSMSQDTYEVIVQCMNLDPAKRSLVGARDALRRVVSFTTLDEALDDFCTADRRVVASANREPLRTPSIQSPQADIGAFPWAKALHGGTNKIQRQLSVIADNDDDDDFYSEDLFSKSEHATDWLSSSALTPSISSAVDSSLAASMQSVNIGSRLRPVLGQRSPNKGSAVAASLPITMSRARNMPSSMSMIFGRKDQVSKSWSDMWDEDEQEEEQDRQRAALKELNSRTWSQDSAKGASAPPDEDDTPRIGMSPATKAASLRREPDAPAMNAVFASADIDEDLIADGFFFQDALPQPEHKPSSPTLASSCDKRDDVDKWAALGARRRAYTGGKAKKQPAAPSSFATGRSVGGALTSDMAGSRNGAGHSPVIGSSPHGAHHLFGGSPFNSTHHSLAQHAKHYNTLGVSALRDRVKECPWNKGRENREWNWNFNWRKEKRPAFEDAEWVGGWQESRSPPRGIAAV